MSVESDIVQLKEDVAVLKKELARWKGQMLEGDAGVSQTMANYVKTQLAAIIARIEKLERQ